jgi:GTP-binding protein
MDIKFVKSSSDSKTCPPDRFPEFAFIGRSNVGKSSLINYIAGIKNLAKTSSKPGKTQLINHFIVNGDDKNNSWYLVDLPGYGYAKTSKTNLELFDKLIRGYTLSRKNLFCLFVLIDSRLEPQKSDIQFLTFLGENNIPFVLVFTKTDKISSNEFEHNLSVFKKTLLKSWESLPEIFSSSVIKKKGREEILAFIEKTINSNK